jgi:hypothetical protein
MAPGILWTLMWGIVGVLASFYVTYVLQALAWPLILSKKHMGLKSLKGYWSGIFLSPIFMVFYGIADTLGVMMKPKWAKVASQSREEKLSHDECRLCRGFRAFSGIMMSLLSLAKENPNETARFTC